jgi:hypothetical protein
VPDLPVEPNSPGRYPTDMESRVAVLEQIARTTTAALERIERRIDMQAAEITWASHRAPLRLALIARHHVGRLRRPARCGGARIPLALTTTLRQTD